MVAPIGTLLRIRVDSIKVLTQTRKKFSKESITELAASIESSGLLQPITVRHEGRDPSPNYVLLYGERRLKAVVSLGWQKIDAILVPGHIAANLDDGSVGKNQIIENMQREDLEPMEEAEAYVHIRATVKGIDTVDDLAAKVGRTVAYVYRRMRLNDLIPKFKKALREGELGLKAAEEIARQEQSVQQLYVKHHPQWFGDVDDVRRFLKHVVRNDLNNAPFDKTDNDLVASASPCAKCPKRTGFAPNLFDDDEQVAGHDICQDPTCYGAKVVAHLKARIAAEKPDLLIAVDFSRAPWLEKLKLKKEIVGSYDWTAATKADGKKAVVVAAQNQKMVGTVRWVKKGRQEQTHQPSADERFKNRVTKWEQRVIVELKDREAKLVASKIRRVGRREAEFLIWSMWDESHYETRKIVLKTLGLELVKTQQHGTTFNDEDSPLRKYIGGLKNVPALMWLAVVIATAPCGSEYEYATNKDREKKYREIHKALKIDRTKLRADVVKDLPRPTKPKAAKKATTKKIAKRKAKK